MVGYVVDAEQTFMVSSLLHSYQFCIRHPFMEFCSCFEQMYHIGIVLGFSSRLGKEFLSDADSMHIRSLDNSSFGWFIIDYSGCKVFICPLNGFFICFSKFLW